MKEKFIKSTIILLFGGLITKILGMVIKVVMTRTIGLHGVSLYMIVLPTFSLFISLGQIGLPISLSRLVALDKMNNHRLYFSILPFVILFNSLLTLVIIMSARLISNNLFHNPDLYLAIVAIGLVIPFTSLSGVCRSYFFGKERMFPHVLSNISEDVVRLLLMVFLLPRLLHMEMKYIIFFIIIFNVISEVISVLVLILFLPRNISFSSCDFSIDKSYVSHTMRIAIPNISSSFLGNVVYFLEPIVLTNMLLLMGYSNTYIMQEYGIITGYVIPIILLPSFFTSALSQAILPYISREYGLGHYENVKSRIYLILFILLILGIFICSIFEIFGGHLLSLIYKTNLGFNYLKIIAPFCILQYIQSPITFSLNAIGKAKDIFYISLFSSFVRIISLVLFSLLKIGIYSFILSLIVNILFNTYMLLRVLNRNLCK